LPEWSLWLDEHLLAPVAHRRVALTIPRRLRIYFLYDGRRLGQLSHVASRAASATPVGFALVVAQ
jgi:hypothetical protein